MKYICSATIKQLPEQPQSWLSFIAKVLKLNATQQKCIEQSTVFQHPGHIQASCFFRTAFDALHHLRTANALSIELSPKHSIKDISVRFTRYENTVFFFFLVETPSAPTDEKELNDQQDELLKLLNDTYAEHINFDFHVTSKVEQFKELLRYQPITPVYDHGETASEGLLSSYVKKHKGENYQRYYKNAYSTAVSRKYTGDGKSNYVREQRSILCLNTALKELSDRQNPDTQRSQLTILSKQKRHSFHVHVH